MDALCGCSTTMLDIEHASWVLRGVPFCHRHCMERHEQQEDRRIHARAEQYAREHPKERIDVV